MKTCKSALDDILDINCDTSYDKAKTIIKDKYTLDLSRSNYDKIKSVRRKNKKGKKINKKKKNNNSSIVVIGEGGNGSSPRTTRFNKIDDDMIEEIILERANSGETLSDNFIKTCIYFYKDIRGKDDKIQDNIDMEDFLNIGTALKDSG